jgi:hypothetical protein
MRNLVWLRFRRQFELAVDFTITRCSFIKSMFSSTRDMSVEYWKSGLSHFAGRVLPWSRIASVEKHSEGLSTMHPYEMTQSNNGLCWGSSFSCFDCPDLRETRRMAGHSLVFTPRLLSTIYKSALPSVFRMCWYLDRYKVDPDQKNLKKQAARLLDSWW